MIKTHIAGSAAIFTFGLAALGGTVVALAVPANADNSIIVINPNPPATPPSPGSVPPGVPIMIPRDPNANGDSPEPGTGSLPPGLVPPGYSAVTVPAGAEGILLEGKDDPTRKVFYASGAGSTVLYDNTEWTVAPSP